MDEPLGRWYGQYKKTNIGSSGNHQRMHFPFFFGYFQVCQGLQIFLAVNLRLQTILDSADLQTTDSTPLWNGKIIYKVHINGDATSKLMLNWKCRDLIVSDTTADSGNQSYFKWVFSR